MTQITQEYPKLHPSLRATFTPLPAKADETTDEQIAHLFDGRGVKQLARRLAEDNANRLFNTGE